MVPRPRLLRRGRPRRVLGEHGDSVHDLRGSEATSAGRELLRPRATWCTQVRVPTLRCPSCLTLSSTKTSGFTARRTCRLSSRPSSSRVRWARLVLFAEARGVGRAWWLALHARRAISRACSPSVHTRVPATHFPHQAACTDARKRCLRLFGNALGGNVSAEETQKAAMEVRFSGGSRVCVAR